VIIETEHNSEKFASSPNSIIYSALKTKYETMSETRADNDNAISMLFAGCDATKESFIPPARRYGDSKEQKKYDQRNILVSSLFCCKLIIINTSKKN
jgi:hypothetical protein